MRLDLRRAIVKSRPTSRCLRQADPKRRLTASVAFAVTTVEQSMARPCMTPAMHVAYVSSRSLGPPSCPQYLIYAVPTSSGISQIVQWPALVSARFPLREDIGG